MFKRMRQDWRQFRGNQPGRRFRMLYQRHHAPSAAPRSAASWYRFGAAVVLIVAGPIVGLVPGPGGAFLFLLGMVLLATEVRWAAGMLDWLDPKLRRVGSHVKRHWMSLPIAVRVLLIAASTGIAFAWSYWVYTRWFSA